LATPAIFYILDDSHTHVDTYPLRNICALKSAIHGFDFFDRREPGTPPWQAGFNAAAPLKKKTEKKGTKDLTARITTLDATY